MFDFGIDKMIVVAVLVGLIMGPERLRDLRHSLPQHIGRLHALYLQGRAHVVDELNELAPDWREYDPRQLHPRRILQDLNAAAAASAPPEVSSGVGPGEPLGRADDAVRPTQGAVPDADADADADAGADAGGPGARNDDGRGPSPVRASPAQDTSSEREVDVDGSTSGTEEQGQAGSTHKDDGREPGPSGGREA